MKQSINDSFFHQTSVAIAGASTSYNIGHAFVSCMLDSGFKGKIYPINPSGGEILGLKVYQSIDEVPGTIDYVISCIPARSTPQLVKDSAAKGAKIVTFFTAGYSESGRREGSELEEELLRVARASGVRLLGPNCLGLYCPEIGLSFACDFPKEKGNVGFISQSGGNSIYLIRAAGQRGIRFSKAISYGNALDVDESDLFEYFAGDRETQIVAAYVEGVRDGQRFLRVLKKLSAVKPVIVVKGGCTGAGAVAASSHTGSLAGSDEAWRALVNQTGAISVSSLDDLADMLVTFSCMRPPQGRNMAICGSNGGFTVLSADEFVSAGFSLPPLPPADQREMDDVVARFSNTDAGMILRNPFDITNVGSGDGHYTIMRNLAENGMFDLLVAQVSVSNSGWPHGESPFRFWPDMFLDAFLGVCRAVSKPVAVIIHSAITETDCERALELQRKCSDAGLPVYDSISSAARAMDCYLRYCEKGQDSPAS
jgi:acyl-CoA synthetase (NDP forming)